MSERHKDKCEIPEQLKTTIGRLIIVIAAEAEPTKKLHFTSSLISEIRSALLIMIRYWKVETIDESMWSLIRSMIGYVEDSTTWEPEVMAAYIKLKDNFLELEKARIHRSPENKTYAESTTLEKSKFEINSLLRDYYEILKSRKNWQSANKIYFRNPNAWEQTNAMLADIHDVIIDVANKRDLIIIPKNTYFSIDELNNYSTFKTMNGDEKHG